MRASVLANWMKVNTQFEGWLPFMYTDDHDPPLVTTGMGNLADPVGLALAMPWKNPDGSLADQATIAAQWQAVKDGPPNSSVNAGPLTTIRLTQTDIQNLVSQKLASNEAELRSYFPGWDSFPADGQFGILSMSWAMGSGFPAKFPQFTAAVNAGDWTTAGADSNYVGAGSAPRIAADKIMFANAAKVVSAGLDPTTFYYPAQASGMSMRAKRGLVVAAAGAAAMAIPDVRHVVLGALRSAWRAIA